MKNNILTFRTCINSVEVSFLQLVLSFLINRVYILGLKSVSRCEKRFCGFRKI
jgi:hypothetical protein